MYIWVYRAVVLYINYNYDMTIDFDFFFYILLIMELYSVRDSCMCTHKMSI